MLALKVGKIVKLLSTILLSVFASVTAIASPDLKVGDIILQPLDCWTCSLIEAEERTIYSHMGLVLEVHPRILVGEAFGTVKLTPLEEFAQKTQRNQRMLVLRLKNPNMTEFLGQQKSPLMAVFRGVFLHKPYDPEFLWDNVDRSGNEKFYCSEFIAKLLSGFLRVTFPIKRMHYNVNRSAWEKYFNGNVPDGKWGNSPADFERSGLFYKVREL